jgi:hypothetical protein
MFESSLIGGHDESSSIYAIFGNGYRGVSFGGFGFADGEFATAGDCSGGAGQLEPVLAMRE